MKKVKKTPSLLIYGGTFSPVHCGHLQIAQQVQQHFRFDEFLFSPCKAPVLDKQWCAPADDRVAMLQLALQGQRRFQIDLTEIQRAGPSYTVDTLLYWRGKRGVDVSISLLLGMDSFLQLPRWSRWELLLELAHLVIVDRATATTQSMDEVLTELLRTHQTDLKTDLLTEPYGKIYRFNAGDYPVSSSQVREAIAHRQDISQWVPLAVENYINAHAVFDII
jgi:nicotinate-nucleotide adenylyltransferase